MKSKLFRILGVVAVVAMIAASLVAPVSANVSGVSATVTSAGGVISTAGNYTIYATLSNQLTCTTSGTITLPYVNDAVKFTSNATTGAADQVNISVSSGTIAANLTIAGAGVYTATNTTSGVITFTGNSQVENITALVAGTVVSYKDAWGTPAGPVVVTEKSGPATVSGTAFTLPDVGDAITFTAAVATNTVTLSPTTGFTVTGTGVTYTAGVISFAVAGQIATVTATTAQIVGTVTLFGSPTFTAVTDVTNFIGFSTPTVSADSITVTFPTGFTVPATGVTGSLAATAGWVTIPGASTPANIPAVVTGAAITSNSTALTVTETLVQGDYIGANSQILFNINGGVVNPGTAGNYTVTVATSQETTAVTSSVFAISNPTPATLPGVASVYNTASTPVLINQTNSLNQALIWAVGVSGGATIKLTAGTYTDAVASYGTAGTSVITIQGTDPSAANVIIKSTGAWTLTGKTIVIDSVTINGKTGTATVVGSSAATVSNSNITTGALTIGATGTGTSNVTKDTFTVATGATGLAVTSPTTVTGSTFNLTGTGWGISAPANVTVTGSTFTGASNTTDVYLGNGISVTATTGAGTSISGDTFTGLTSALNVSGGTVAFAGNTVTNCGEAAPPAAAASPAIVIAAGTTAISITGNTITNGASNIVTVAAGLAPVVNVTQNTFTGNAKTASSADTANTLNLARNWWGGAANVPANVTLVAGTTAGLQFTPALGGAPGTAGFATVAAGTTANPIAASATVGVNITSVTSGAAAIVGATALSANPVAVAIPSADTAVKYWDVYGTISGVTAGATVDFYGTTAAPVTAANSAVLFYNSVTGTWVNAGGAANAFANYFEIYVGATTGSVITAAQFNGTPFVLVTFPTTLGTIGTTTYPTNGATGVAVSATNTTFTWPAVTPPAGMTVTYQFALAQASANTTSNEFAILDYSDNTITNAEPLQETLQYNTIYWWEVRAVTLNASGAVAATGPWTVSMFTTAPQPVTTTGTAATNTTVVTSVVITNPVTTVVSTQTSVVITQTTGSSTQAIPSYLLWAVIAVGAVLIIAVIVLIVRTRRIP